MRGGEERGNREGSLVSWKVFCGCAPTRIQAKKGFGFASVRLGRVGFVLMKAVLVLGVRKEGVRPGGGGFALRWGLLG